MCTLFEHRVSLSPTQSLYPYKLKCCILPSLNKSWVCCHGLSLRLEWIPTTMSCFARIRPHDHLSEFSHAEVLLCILFLNSTPVPAYDLHEILSLLSTTIQSVSLSIFLPLSSNGPIKTWVNSLHSKWFINEGPHFHTFQLEHSTPVTGTFFIFPSAPTWTMLHFEWTVLILVPLTRGLMVFFQMLVILAFSQHLQDTPKIALNF